MSVRVIAGAAKGRRLQVPPTDGVRPTGDRARETLFNVLAPRIRGVAFLDAFAGSGAVGIEALSRGAASAVFIERDRSAVRVLTENVDHCGFAERAEVLPTTWVNALHRLAENSQAFGIAFFDPPYEWEEAHTCLQALAEHALVAPGGIAIIEHRRATPPREAAGWEALRRLDVGDTSFSFFGILAAS